MRSLRSPRVYAWGVVTRNFAAFLLALAVGIASGCGGGSLSSKVSAANGKPAKAMKDEPEITFKDFEGNNVTLASFKGKVVLVNFWATWCDPCRVEIPWLIEFQQKYAGSGFTLLGVAMDEGGAKVVEPFVEKITFDVNGRQMNMNYPIVIGNDDIADRFGGLIGYPASFLITRDGKIAKKYLGLVSEDDLDKDIQALLR
jgi:thiol-disulfide isomerase/thioredoxin